MGSTNEYETHLQSLAEHVTEEGLNFVGAEFDHLETGESFTVTVAKTSTVKELNDRAKLLESVLFKHKRFCEEVLSGYEATNFYKETVEVLKGRQSD